MTDDTTPAAPADPDDRPCPPRRRDDRDGRDDGQGRRGRPPRRPRRRAPAARWARSSSPTWTRPTTTAGWARSARASSRRAMGELGVTEWENLGYRDSDMMGRRREPRPALLLAGRPRRGRSAPDVARPPLPAGRRHDLQRLRRVRPPRPHPDPRRRGPRPSRGPATRPGTPSSSRPSTAARARRPMPAASRRGRRPSSTSRRSRRRCATRCGERMEAAGEPSFWSPPEDATPEQLAEFEAFQAKMLVPDESITTWIDVGDDRSSASGRRSTST